MQIRKASCDEDFEVASKLLMSVASYLSKIEQSLWNKDQVSVDGLKALYTLHELHFFICNNEIVGVVFIQNEDAFFWPEIDDGKSMFIHKLAIHPKYSGYNYGGEAIRLILSEADKQGVDWVRLDCDDRAPLHEFYRCTGFSLVDIVKIQGYFVARYNQRVG